MFLRKKKIGKAGIPLHTPVLLYIKYIKVGFKGIYITRARFRDGPYFELVLHSLCDGKCELCFHSLSVYRIFNYFVELVLLVSRLLARGSIAPPPPREFCRHTLS